MNDIQPLIERLRKEWDGCIPSCLNRERAEAADTIERYKRALEKIGEVGAKPDSSVFKYMEMVRIAREALSDGR